MHVPNFPILKFLPLLLKLRLKLPGNVAHGDHTQHVHSARPHTMASLPAHSGQALWLEQHVHNYAHLLNVTVPRHPALLAVKANLVELSAYSAAYMPAEAVEELTSYLLSWAATVAPFKMLPKSFCVLGERTTFSPTMSSAVKLLHLARALGRWYLVNN